ncbi:GIY-YIG nuclease family protein [Pseudothermotoga sp.]|nr:DUF123 domain-containing protein [Pseudothermotoga sp.]MCX7812558.1 DUF123 domain-containing protein [Pseudothermotoga sp.]MDW8138837.1 DUF123 domain-containing protein [Pseudothermotoga sp.]
MKGTYLLLIQLDHKATIKNRWVLEAGLYVYVGSAMNGLLQRIGRHLKKGKKNHWHIDHLLQHGKILSVIMLPCEEKLEENVSNMLAEKFGGPKGFGSSDLKVRTNLYKVDDMNAFCSLLGRLIEKFTKS